MKIKVIGGCCRKATLNFENAKEAARLCGVEGEVELISDFEEIASLGILATPGLVINDKVMYSGKAQKVKEIVALIEKEKKKS